MKIYEFSTYYTKKGELFSVREIEAAESAKTYSFGHRRIKKADIGCVDGFWGKTMYSIENDPNYYVSAVVKLLETKIEDKKRAIEELEQERAKWKELEVNHDKL